MSEFIVENIAPKFVVKKLVDVAFVTTEEEAKIFSANRLRNLLRDVPSEYTLSRAGTTSLTVEVPVTVRLVAVVVASVEVPKTVSVPEAYMPPPTPRLPPIFCPPEIVEVPTNSESTVRPVPEALEKVV